jgi:hypothetical protein
MKPVGKKAIITPSGELIPLSVPGRVTVSITRKISTKAYESLDVFLSASSDIEPDEDQSKATHRIFSQLRTDMQKILADTKEIVKAGSL